MTLSRWSLVALVLLASRGESAPSGGDPWFRFEDTTLELVGYKDAAGVVKIPPSLNTVTNSVVFRSFIPAFENASDSGGPSPNPFGFFLRKDGSRFGLDSVYLSDFTPDCLHGGMVRFRDWKSDKVGFFDSTGKVAIPALFDDADPFENGWSRAIVQAHRVGEGGKPCSKANSCEHWAWEGKWILVDRTGRTVSSRADLPDPYDVDWHHPLDAAKATDSGTIRIPSDDGTVLAFPSLRRTFEHWLRTGLAQALKSRAWQGLLLDTLPVAEKSEWKLPPSVRARNKGTAWAFPSRQEMVLGNGRKLHGILLAMAEGRRHPRISRSYSPWYLSYIGDGGYLDDCGEHRRQIHPGFEVSLDPAPGSSEETRIGFIRTDSGYKVAEIE